jgi:uncharacterized membrane protein YadS
MAQSALQLVPGLVLLAVLGYLAKSTEQTINNFRCARLRSLLDTEEGAREGRVIENKARFLWQKMPKFVPGFLLLSLLTTVGVFDKAQITDLANLSRWAFLLTFAGVGLRTDLREMKKQGFRPFVVGAVGELVIAAVTLVVVLISTKTLGL